MGRFVNALVVMLAAFAWLGTRYIRTFGSLAGRPNEFGTIGIFATELLAIEIAVLAAAAFWRRRAVFRRREVAAALALAALALVSVAWSPDRHYAFLSVARLALGAGVMIAMIIFQPRKDAVLGALLGGAAVNALLGFGQVLMQRADSSLWFGIAAHRPSDLGTFVVETASGRWLRAYGAVAHPNILGLLCVVGILAACGLALAADSEKKRAVLFGVTVLLAAGLTVAFSRGAFLSLIFGAIAMIAILRSAKTPRSNMSPLYRSLAAVDLVTALFAGIYHEAFLTRVEAIGRHETRSISERLRSFDDARRLIIKNPVTGVGIGQMPLAVLNLVGPDPSPSRFQAAHDEGLLVTAELGILGLILWLFIRVRLIQTLFISIKRGGEDKFLNAAVFGIIIALLTSGLVDHFLWDSWFGQLLFWLTAGLAFSESIAISGKKAPQIGNS